MTIEGVGTPLTESPWQKAEPLAWQSVQDEAVILDMEKQMLRGLNASAWRIWELIDGQRGTRDIVEAYASHFKIPVERAHHDVSAFLKQLEDRSLARRVP